MNRREPERVRAGLIPEPNSSHGRADTPEEPLVVLASQFVLPDTQDAPALLAQSAVDEPVATLVGLQLAFPKRRI